MLIEQFDAKTDDDRLAACHQISVSGHTEDDPNVPEVTWRRFQAWWRYGFASEPVETWLATDDDQQPTGCYLLWLPERAPDRRGRQSRLREPVAACRVSSGSTL